MDNDCILQAQMSFALREIEDDYLTPFNVNGWPTSMYLSDDSELPRDWLVHGIVISGDLHVSGSYQVKPSTSSSSSSSSITCPPGYGWVALLLLSHLPSRLPLGGPPSLLSPALQDPAG